MDYQTTLAEYNIPELKTSFGQDKHYKIKTTLVYLNFVFCLVFYIIL